MRYINGKYLNFFLVLLICFVFVNPLVVYSQQNFNFSGNKNSYNNFSNSKNSVNPEFELNPAPNINDFFEKYNTNFVHPESYLPPNDFLLANNDTYYYDYDQNLLANIDLSKTSYHLGEIVEYSIQITSNLNYLPHFPLFITIVEGDSYYDWYYGYGENTILDELYVETDDNGFYFGSFLPQHEGSFSIFVIPYTQHNYAIARRVVTVSDISVFWRIPYSSTKNAYTLSYALVMNTSDYSPLANANVTLFIEKWFNYDNFSKEVLFSGVSNDIGLITIDYIIDSSPVVYSNLILNVEYLDSTVEMKQYIWFYSYYYYGNSVKEYQVYNFITTLDKPIYQPGDTIKTRTIVFQDDYWQVKKEPAILTEVEVEFKSKSGFMLFHKKLITDDFGIIEWQYNLDEDTSLGEYSLIFKKDSSKDVLKIEVDKYEKPDFKVNIDLEKEFVPPGHYLKGKIIAEYYFGKPVLGTVLIEFNSKGEILDSIEGQLNSNGEFSFSWRIPSRRPFSSEPIEALIVRALVTDPINRQVQSEKEVTCNSEMYTYIWTDPYSVFQKKEKITAYFSAYQVGIDPQYYWYSWTPIANASVSITIYGLTVFQRKIELFTLNSYTDQYGSGFVNFIIPEEYYKYYYEYIIDLTIKTLDGRIGKNYQTIALAIIQTIINIFPTNNLLPGDNFQLSISLLNIETNKLVNGKISVYIMDAEYDSLYYVWDYSISGTETFMMKLGPYAPFGKYYINTYCQLEDKYNNRYFAQYSSTHSEFIVGSDYSLYIQPDKEIYTTDEEIILSGQLSHQSNSPTIIELTKRGIVEIITIDKTLTEFSLHITNLMDFAPKLTIFAYSITPTGIILEAYAIIEIIREINAEITTDKTIYEPGETATVTITVTDENNNPIEALGVFSLIDSSIFAVKEDALLEELPFKDEDYWAQISTRSSWTGFMSYWWYWWARELVYTNYQQTDEFYFGGQPRSTDALEIYAPPSFEGEIRDNLPESTNWLPKLLISDGQAIIKVPLPDNIGEWTVRLFITANSLGAIVKKTFKTFLPFFVDLKIPQGAIQDNVIIIRGIAYNYLSDNSLVSLQLDADQLIILNNPNQTLVIPKDYLIEIRWSIYCKDFGKFNITLIGIATINGNNWFDGIRKQVNIDANGVTFETIESGFLNQTQIFQYELFKESVYTDLDLIISPGIMDIAITSWERLIGYPYGCIEQTMSKIFPDIMIYQYLNQTSQLTDTLAAILDDMLQMGLSKIAAYQHYDGGWGWWEEDQSQTYMTATVLYGLGLMKELGFGLSQEHLTKGINYILTNQLVSGGFSTDSWRIDDLSFTAYVIRSLLVNDLSDSEHLSSLNNAIIYFKTEWLENSPLINPYAAALFVEATEGTIYEDTDFLDELIDYILLEAIVEEEGLKWTISDEYWRALGGTIETTATVVSALTGYDFMTYFITIRCALTWLLSQQSYWGWGNTADTSAAIKAIISVAQYYSEPIDCKIDVTIGTFSTQLVLNESESEFLSTVSLDLDQCLEIGNNSIIITQNGTGQIYYYLSAKQILRVDPQIKINTPIYANPGETVAVTIMLNHNSNVVYPVNVLLISLEEYLETIGPKNQTIQILTGNTSITFNYNAPENPGEYLLAGYTIHYIFADSLLKHFSPGVVVKSIIDIPIIVQNGLVNIHSDSKQMGINQYVNEAFLIKQSEYDISLERDYSKTSNFIRGETITVTLTISNQWDKKEFIMVEDAIPSGFTVDESSLKNNPNIIDYSITSSRLTLFMLKIVLGQTILSYRLITLDIGSSIALPTKLSSMYESWSIESNSEVLGDLTINTDPETGEIKTDGIIPIMLKRMVDIKNNELSYDVSINIRAYDNDEIVSCVVIYSTTTEKWKTIDTSLTTSFNNNTKDYSIDLGSFTNEKISYLICIEDRTGNVFYTQVEIIIIPGVILALIFIFIAVLVSFTIATSVSLITKKFKPKPSPVEVIDHNVNLAFKETKEDLEAYSKLDDYKNNH